MTTRAMATNARIQTIVDITPGASTALRIHVTIAAMIAMTATWMMTSMMAVPVRMVQRYPAGTASSTSENGVSINNGRGGFRTCDLSRVKRALSH